MTMRNPFDEMTEPLDPETQQMVDEVCAAVTPASDDPWAETPASALVVGWAWLVALRKSGSHECRQAIFDLVDRRVRTDPDLFIGHQGYMWTREQIAAHHGKIDYQRGDDGHMRKVLRFPKGVYASGRPAYDDGEAA